MITVQNDWRKEMDLKFLDYCKIMFCVVITVLIILSLPITICVILYLLNVVNWIIIISSLCSAFFTIYVGLRFVDKAIDQIWI